MVETALARMMVSAFHDRSAGWDAVCLGLRDAIVDHARGRCEHWARVASRGTAFEDIPPLTKATIRADWDALQARGFTADERAEGETGGSTGEPTRYALDVGGIGASLAALAALRTVSGIPPAAVTCFLYSKPFPRETVPAEWATCSVEDLSPDGVRALLADWRDLPDHWLWGRASALEEIAAVMQREGLRLERPPVAVVTTMDMLDEAARPRLAEAFGCDVRSWYGSKETSPALAGTLADGRYAVNPLFAHVEVVDDDARPVAPGEIGRVLVTDLHNRVMPMIRYDLGDLAVRSADRHGAWPVLERLEGRSSEVLRLPSGRTISATVLGLYVVGAGLTQRIRGYQCLQRAPNELELRLVFEDGGPTPEERRAARDAVRAIADPDTRIDVVAVEALETLPSGKRWIVRRAA